MSILSSSVYARTLGIYGHTFTISEPDFLEHVKTKLVAMQADGTLKEHQEILVKRVRAKVARPDPVRGVIRATEPRTFTYDPSITLPQDLKGHQGRVFYKAGTRINPLDYFPLSSGGISKELVFFDGDDEEQKEWVHKQLQDKSKFLKPILVNGAPLELSKEWQTQVYFDQQGVLIRKFGIKQVPATVKQSNKLLVIKEMVIK